MATTLLQLRDRAKEESDNVNSQFLTDAEWNKLIQSSYQELYGLLVQTYGNDYFVQTPFVITTDGINSLFALPTDFFKMLGVDLQISAPNQYVALKPFDFAERNRLSGWNANGSIPMAGQVVRLFYVPLPTIPLLDASTIDGVNGWEEYIIVDAAMKALGKEESDVSVMAMRKQALITRLESEAENRDAGSPATVADVYGSRGRGMMYRISGNNLWLIGNGQPAWDWNVGDSF